MQCHLKLCVKMKSYIHPAQYELIESDIMTTVFIDYVSLGLFSLWPLAKKSCQFNHTQILPTYRFWAARWIFDKKPCFRKLNQCNDVSSSIKWLCFSNPFWSDIQTKIPLHLQLFCICICIVVVFYLFEIIVNYILHLHDHHPLFQISWSVVSSNSSSYSYIRLWMLRFRLFAKGVYCTIKKEIMT